MSSPSLNNSQFKRKNQLHPLLKRLPQPQEWDLPNLQSYHVMYLVLSTGVTEWHVSMMETATVAAVLSLSLANKRGACLSSTEICALLLSMLLNTRFKKTDLRWQITELWRRNHLLIKNTKSLRKSRAHNRNTLQSRKSLSQSDLTHSLLKRNLSPIIPTI